MFETEKEMSKKFERYLKKNFGNTYIKEYHGLFGIPDFVWYENDRDEVAIVSFELKLTDWKRAAKQAFRYKSFSDVTYVVMPEKALNAALENITMFEKYNIGLASFDIESSFKIAFKPNKSEPFSNTLRKKLLDSINRSRKKARELTSSLIK